MIFKTRTRPKDEQGGDWGSFITANLATLFPENLVGLHLNLPPVSRSHCEQSAARHQHQDMLHSVISCLFICRLHISFHNDNQGDLVCILLISLPSSWLHDNRPHQTDVERWRFSQTVCSLNSGPWTTSGRRRGSSLGKEEIRLIGRLWCWSRSRRW